LKDVESKALKVGHRNKGKAFDNLAKSLICGAGNFDSKKHFAKLY